MDGMKKKARRKERWQKEDAARTRSRRSTAAILNPEDSDFGKRPEEAEWIEEPDRDPDDEVRDAADSLFEDLDEERRSAGWYGWRRGDYTLGRGYGGALEQI